MCLFTVTCDSSAYRWVAATDVCPRKFFIAMIGMPASFKNSFSSSSFIRRISLSCSLTRLHSMVISSERLIALEGVWELYAWNFLIHVLALHLYSFHNPIRQANPGRPPPSHYIHKVPPGLHIRDILPLLHANGHRLFIHIRTFRISLSTMSVYLNRRLLYRA